MENKNQCTISKLDPGRVSKGTIGGGLIIYFKYKPRRILIHDLMLLDGKLNVYQLVHDYAQERKDGNLLHP